MGVAFAIVVAGYFAITAPELLNHRLPALVITVALSYYFGHPMSEAD